MKELTLAQNSKYILSLLKRSKRKVPSPYNKIESIVSSQKIRDYKFEGVRTKLMQYEGLTKDKETIKFYSHYSSEQTRKFLTQWLFLDYLSQNGFLKPPLLVPKPIIFIKRDNLFIREDVIGKAVLYYLKNNDSQHLREVLTLAAQWLLKLQGLKIKDKKIFTPISDIEKEEFNHYLKVACARFSAKSCNKIKKVLNIVHKHTKLYNAKNKKSTLIHGDFQPTNVIYSQGRKNLTTIDFDWSGIGDPLSDVGNFIFQLEYHSSQYLTQAEILQYKKIFLDTYFKKQPTEQEERRINIYQAKFAIQRVIFNAEFLIPKSKKPEDDPTVKNLINGAIKNVAKL